MRVSFANKTPKIQSNQKKTFHVLISPTFSGQLAAAFVSIKFSFCQKVYKPKL